MPYPFVCTNTTTGNYDYGTPITANKSTDYRTSTGTYHRLIPEKAQEFDARVKAIIKPELLQQSVVIRDENVKSITKNSYFQKFAQKGDLDNMKKPSRLTDVHYIRNVQERVFKNPPPPMECAISEMKDAYYRAPVNFYRREVWPPEPYALCEVKALGRDEMPAIRPGDKGFYKWLDPYLTVNKVSYPPYSIDQQNGIARKDIVTCYDLAQVPKAKGFGPRNCPTIEPLVPRKKIPMLDQSPFKFHPSDRRVRIIPNRIPNFGKTSEMKASFRQLSFSDVSSFTWTPLTDFPESLSKTSAWQNLAAPGMYCTEYCHIGTNWPVNAVINSDAPKRVITHKPCFTKFCDWSQ